MKQPVSKLLPCMRESPDCPNPQTTACVNAHVYEQDTSLYVQLFPFPRPKYQSITMVPILWSSLRYFSYALRKCPGHNTDADSFKGKASQRVSGNSKLHLLLFKCHPDYSYLVDIIYFRFTMKRLTGDIFHTLK